MIKKLAKYMGEYKLHSILTPIFVIFEVFLEVLIPFLMSEIIDNGIEASNLGYTIKMGLLLVVFALLALLFGALSGHFAASASSGYAKNLRKEIFYKIQGYSFANIDKFSTSSLVTRLTTDVTNVQQAFQMIIRIAVRCPVMLVTALIMAFVKSPKLSLIFVAMIPFLGIGLYVIMKHAHPIFERVFKKYDHLNNVVQENIRGIRVVKSFVREDKENEKFGEVSTSIYKDFSKAERILAFNNPLMQFCVYTSILLISWFGARFIIGGVDGMTTGDLTSMVAYVMQILMSLMMISMVLVMITISEHLQKEFWK